MRLSAATYFAPEMQRKYMSVSTYKAFMDCEARAMAELTGEAQKAPMTTSLLVGSYVDAYFEGTLDKFVAEHPEIISSKGPTAGKLKADYRHAEEIIERVKRDKLFMLHMSGRKQVIETATLFNCKWKIKIDSLLKDRIVDLKVMKDMERTWHNGQYGSFVEAWGYDTQLAIYQRVHELKTGKHLPVYIACVTKEPTPDLAIIHIPDWRLEECLAEVEKNMPRILAVRSGKTAARRCEACNYCRETKVLTEAIDFQLVGMTAAQIEMAQGTV